jgi:hypothetical protein
MSFRSSLNSRLRGTYNDVVHSDLLKNGDLSLASLNAFESLLNLAQPKDDTEMTIKHQIHFMYRQNPRAFYEWVVRSGMEYLILWTESKIIVMHFQIKTKVYIRWDDGVYAVVLHRNLAAPVDAQNLRIMKRGPAKINKLKQQLVVNQQAGLKSSSLKLLSVNSNLSAAADFKVTLVAPVVSDSPVVTSVAPVVSDSPVVTSVAPVVSDSPVVTLVAPVVSDSLSAK